MAAADQQFLDALRFLGQSGQAFGISRQMNDVNERADEIRNTMTDEIQKRQALQNLAQQASVRVSGAGGNSQQLAAISNLTPPIPTSVQDAYLRGTMTGDTQMVEVAKKMQDEDQNRKLQLQQKEFAYKLMAQKAEAANSATRDPVLNAIRKENYDKFGEAQTSVQKAEEFKGKLLSLRKLLSSKEKDTFADTGPVDQYLLGTTDKGQQIQKIMSQLSLDTISSTFKGMGSVINSEGERAFFNKAQLSPSDYPAVNLKNINDQIKRWDDISNRGRAMINTYKQTGGVSVYGMDAGKAPNPEGFTNTSNDPDMLYFSKRK